MSLGSPQSPSLPAKLRVPATPPHIHRQLIVRQTKNGIEVDPAAVESEGLLIPWGLRPQIQRRASRDHEGLKVAGILGLIHLWDTSYLFLIMPTPPTDQSNHAYVISKVVAIPLKREEGSKALEKLIQKSNRSSKLKWPFLPGPSTLLPDSENAEDEEIPPKGWTENPSRQVLESRIISQIIREFSSGFFYSYTEDLSHTLTDKRKRLSTNAQTAANLSNLLGPDLVDIHLPLWRRSDKRFFWNEHMMQDLIDEGLHAFVLPVIQGWYQHVTFEVPTPVAPGKFQNTELGLIIISRRSRDRAGLRFQRRGIDDNGHVANFVETEMILRGTIEKKASEFSFVQIRGSIPLRWSQQPWSMKPPPVLDHTVEEAYSLANIHFDDLSKRYGTVNIINLSEQKGKEAAVTKGYGELVKLLDRSDVQYKAFDFHAKCHGMKWENISELIDELDFDTMGYTWILDNEKVRDQLGIYRTNCIDCLDRTNVVQSAVARRILSDMLTQLGLATATPSLESVFNDAWANNGDTLSQCYAHTSALKGDFVRTGKRDVTGMLHDGISSLSRMFYGAVSDFFAQAVISFLLGHRNLSVFSEFLESLTSTDASQLVKLSRIRSTAIETCSARILDGEQRVAGWTLLSPRQAGEKLSVDLEEKVVILTEQSLYVVSFNYSLEKVMGYNKIPLTAITRMQKGAYILSPLQEAGRDVTENAGFTLEFSLHESRYSTYSIRNKGSVPSDVPELFAFKILPREFISRGASTFDEDDLDMDAIPTETCQAVVERLVKRVQECCVKAGNVPQVVDEDVVSLSEAQNATSLLTRMDYALKRFLWL